MFDILACPYCRGKLVFDAQSERFVCLECNSVYQWTDNGNLDLRLKRTKKEKLLFEICEPLKMDAAFNKNYLEVNPIPEFKYNSKKIPTHLTKELISYFPKAKSTNSFVLDLGCGTTLHRDVCEFAGFNYVGLDYENPEAPIWGDAHSLPFLDECFEFVLSAAVMEHIQYPFLMIKEVSRVLKKGSLFIGSVAFLEPYHWDSYYHYSHLGLYNLLAYGGFDVLHIAPNKEISVFDSQARLNSRVLFPRMPKWFSTQIIKLPVIASNLWINSIELIKGKNYIDRESYTFTSSFYFIARKAS